MFYPIKIAFLSIFKELWINVLSVMTIATGLLLASMAFFIVHNINLATGKLPESFTITVFLKDDLSKEQTDKLLQVLRRNSAVSNLKYISREDALKELQVIMRDADEVLKGLEGNPLPASVEIHLKKESVSKVPVRELASEIKKIEGVDEVHYAEKFVASIQRIRKGTEAAGIALMTALSLGILFVCYSTVKILFYRKKDEMETLKLLGATRWFIRAPFIVEGGVIGASAGLLALAGAIALRYMVHGELAQYLPLLKSFVFPPETFSAIPLAGVLIGLAGAMIAIGRIRF